MKLGLKPVGPGVYPARLVLTSAYDVRHIELAVTAQARGQAAVLELECPARQKVGGGGMQQGACAMLIRVLCAVFVG
jgi:hypothetical protein